MSIRSVLKAKASSLGETLLEQSLNLGIYVAAGTVIGAGTITAYEVFVNGRYDGNLVERFAQGVRDVIPFVSHDGFLKTVSKDLSAMLVGSVPIASFHLGRNMQKREYELYSKRSKEEEDFDQVRQQGKIQEYKIKQQERTEISQIESQERINKRKQTLNSAFTD